ncbi:MAG: YitT family protein [Nitrospirota bacterium]
MPPKKSWFLLSLLIFLFITATSLLWPQAACPLAWTALCLGLGLAIYDRILHDMERGVTLLHGTGAYTMDPRPVMYCVVTRSEVQQLKTIVHEADPDAFMVIGVAHEALGEGFQPFKKA